MSEKEIPTRDELKKLKVVNLRQRLSKLSLPQGGEMIDIQCHSISGKNHAIKILYTDRTFCYLLFVGLKDDLITRLLEHYQQVGQTIHHGGLYIEFMHTLLGRWRSKG